MMHFYYALKILVENAETSNKTLCTFRELNIVEIYFAYSFFCYIQSQEYINTLVTFIF